MTVWTLMAPTFMGYATISGVPMPYGLHATVLGLMAFALFTTSGQGTEDPGTDFGVCQIPRRDGRACIA